MIAFSRNKKNSQDTGSLKFPEIVILILTAPKKNDMNLTPNMNNLIAEIEHDLKNTAANLKQFEKFVFDVLSTKLCKVTESKAYKQLEDLE